jgi:transposase-like protein
MPGHGEKLSRKKNAAIAALLTQPTITAAAKDVGIDESTLRRWLKEPTFKREFRAAREDVVETAVGRLQQCAGKAVEALERNLASGHPAHEIRAALGILGHAIEAIELLDLVERVGELERLNAEKGDQCR